MRLCAWFKKAMSCSFPTEGKPSRKELNDSPALMYSMNVCTGTRVPAKTGVPPRTSGDEVIIGLGIQDYGTKRKWQRQGQTFGRGGFFFDAADEVVAVIAGGFGEGVEEFYEAVAAEGVAKERVEGHGHCGEYSNRAVSKSRVLRRGPNAGVELRTVIFKV